MSDREVRVVAPSWMASCGFHTILLLILSLFVAAAVRPPSIDAIDTRVQTEDPPAEPSQPILSPEPVEGPVLPEVLPVAESVRVVSLDPPRPISVPREEFETAGSESPAPEFSGASPGFAFLPNDDSGLAEVLGIGTPSSGGQNPAGNPAVKDRFRHRRIGASERLAIGGPLNPTPASEGAVERGLSFLARTHLNGHWDCGRFGGRRLPHPEVVPEDQDGYDVAVTSLGLLTFLGAGHTTTSPKYGPLVRETLYWLEQKQDKTTGKWPGSHYTQGIATLAAAEAYGMGCGQEEMARRGLAYLGKAQNPGGGWNYFLQNRARNDTSISGWALMALKSAQLAELPVDPSLFAGAKRHFDGVIPDAGTSNAGDWKIFYAREGDKFIRNTTAGIDAVGAITMLSLLYLGMTPDTSIAIKAAEYYKARKPNLSDLYYTYYGTLAMFQMGGDYWKAWNANLRDPLVAAQIRGGPDDGSWDPGGDLWGAAGGRIYSTALAVMTLEVYYRHLPIYKDAKK
ncbi:MAG: hypothetical protein AAB215_05025 [Planctomycetota bacterium]